MYKDSLCLSMSVSLAVSWGLTKWYIIRHTL